MAHIELAKRWAQWNGQRGTAQQCARIMRQLDAETLTRMLRERGVVVEG